MPTTLATPADLSAPSIIQTPNNFIPPGVVPEFYALGKHPQDIFEFLSTTLRPAFTRLGILDHYPQIVEYTHTVVREFQAMGSEYIPFHSPSYWQRYLSLAFVRALVDPNNCRLVNSSNYRIASSLRYEGHNVLMVQNHTSVLDTLITYRCLARDYGYSSDPMFMMSQVFQYCDLTALVTAGAHKFPVFQPKHIARMLGKGEARYINVANTMKRQNVASLLALRAMCRDGGKRVLCYPERDRSVTMGPPEPGYLTMLKAMEPTASDSELYIMPMNTTGRDPVIRNAKESKHEVDTLCDRLQIGCGTTYCGPPVKLKSIRTLLARMNKGKLVKDLLGTEPCGECLEHTALGLAFLSMVAWLSPTDRGIYDNDVARKLAHDCYDCCLD